MEMISDEITTSMHSVKNDVNLSSIDYKLAIKICSSHASSNIKFFYKIIQFVP